MQRVRQTKYVDLLTPTGRVRVALLTDGSVRVKMPSPATAEEWISPDTGNATMVIHPEATP